MNGNLVKQIGKMHEIERADEKIGFKFSYLLKEEGMEP